MTARERLPYRKGVGAIVINDDGRVLVARRIGRPDAWQLPQGGMAAGETPREALMRELGEEIGTDKVEILAEAPDWLRYDLPRDLVGQVRKGRFRGQEQRWFAVRLTGTEAEIVLDASDHPEFDAWRWVEIEQLPAFAVDFKRRLYEDLVIAFRPFCARCAQESDGAARAPSACDGA